jgi:hypothetical protein
MVVVVPFIFIWRKDIEYNVKLMIAQNNINYTKSLKSISMVILILLIALNAIGTVKVATIAQNTSEQLTYKVIPENGTDITNLLGKIVIKFDADITNTKRIYHSINCNENQKIPQIIDTWIDPKTLEISFNRDFYEKEY